MHCSDAPAHPSGRTPGLCLGLILAASGATLALTVLWNYSAFRVWDDAYMFARYADVTLATGKIAWYPGGEATYGLTSLLYLAVVVPMRMAVPNVALAMVLCSLASTAAFVVLLLVLIARYTDADRLGRLALTAVTLFALAVASRHLVNHIVSGMDTMFALAFLTAYILLARSYERRPSVRRAVLVGVWGGLAYLARPDLMLYAALVPAALLLLGPDGRSRRHGLLMGGVSALVLGAELAACRAYFGTPLPLPFYAKSTALYGEYIRRWYRTVPIKQLAQFVLSFWFLLAVIGIDVIAGRMRDPERPRRSRVELGLLAATVLFIGYYLFFVTQIMYMGARFYYPTLPAVAFLAAQSLARIGRRAQRASGVGWHALPRPLAWVGALLLVYGLVPLGRLGVEKLSGRLQRGEWAAFDVWSGPQKHNYWYRLDAVSELPDDLVVATTEVGRPVAMNPQMRVIDITGLNEAPFALHGFSADRLLDHYRPDLIYMPHPHYKEIDAAIRSHPTFQDQYELFPAEQLTEQLGKPVEMGMAIRRDSPYYQPLRAIAAGQPPPATSPAQP